MRFDSQRSQSPHKTWLWPCEDIICISSWGSFLKFGKMFPPFDFGGLTTQVKVMATSQNMIMALYSRLDWSEVKGTMTSQNTVLAQYHQCCFRLYKSQSPRSWWLQKTRTSHHSRLPSAIMTKCTKIVHILHDCGQTRMLHQSVSDGGILLNHKLLLLVYV